MSSPLFSVGGLASGLDTAGIVRQLVQLERQPVVRFEQRQAELRKVNDAWGQVTTKLSALRAAVDRVGKPGALTPTKVSSSDDRAVAVSANGTGAPGEVSFTVTRLAAAHRVQAGGSFASSTATVGAGTFTLTAAGTGEQLLSVATTDTTTVEQLAAQINAAAGDITAQALKVADGDVRLLITAGATGAGGSFAVGSSPAAVGTTTVLNQGVDAALRLGSLEVTRSSNTIDDLLPGARIELRAVTTTPVAVRAERDTAATVAAVKGMVDGLNGVLATVKDLTSYDAASKKSKPLQGDDTARRLATDLRAAVSATVTGLTGGIRTAGSVGIELDRYGAVTFDEAAFTKALADNPEGVVALFSRAGSSSDPRVRYVASTDRTAAGEHAVQASQAAQVAATTGSAYSPPTGEPRTFTVTSGGRAVSVTVETDATLATAVTRVNEALRLNGVTTLTAVEGTSGGQPALRLAESRYGTTGNFSVVDSGDWGLDGTHAGVDVAGSIDGVAATGSGTRLTASSGRGAGLVVEVSGADLAGLGPVTVIGGLGGALQGVLRWAEGDRSSADPAVAAGAIGRARATLTDEVRRFDRRIDDHEVRLASRERTLRQKFAALESALARLQSQGDRLAGQLGG
jgi:flagellar hook-associated protein 2